MTTTQGSKARTPQTRVVRRAVTALAAAAFVSELIVAGVLAALGPTRPPVAAGLIAALILAAVVAGAAYVLLLPLRRAAPAAGEPSMTDSVTGVMSRRAITGNLLDAMAHAERYGNPLSVAMLDIDHFKQVNELYGHDAGNQVLGAVGALLTEALRMPDKVGRYRDATFLFVFPETKLEDGQRIVERVRATINQTRFPAGEDTIGLTVSIGATRFHKGEDLEQLLSRAEAALAKAKTKGRTPARKSV